MRTLSLNVPRILALLGATLVIVASMLPWHQYDVVMTTGSGSAERIHGAVNLWSVEPVAGALTGAAGAVAALLLFAAGHHRRAARHIAGAVGLAVAAYALLRWFDAPALAGLIPSAGRPDVLSGGASVDEGIFIMLLGGAALLLSAMESAAALPVTFARAPRETVAPELAP